MTTNLWSACRPCCCEDLAQLECLVSVWWRQCLFGRIWASGVVLGVLHPRVRAASRTGRMMWSWTCSCCTSVGALTGRSRRGGFVPPWPASDAVARSTMCWWRHSRTPSGWASSDRPRSLSTATTRSRVAGSSRRWHVGSSRPLTAERDLLPWSSSWRCCREACRGSGGRPLPHGGSCGARAGTHGVDLLRLCRGLLVQATGDQSVPVGLSPWAPELLDGRTEADDCLLNHCRSRGSDQKSGQPSTRRCPPGNAHIHRTLLGTPDRVALPPVR